MIPEEIVPIEIVGKMVLDRNPDNFFAETEQVAFCPSHIVQGSTSAKTRCCRDGCSLISIRSSAA